MQSDLEVRQNPIQTNSKTIAVYSNKGLELVQECLPSDHCHRAVTSCAREQLQQIYSKFLKVTSCLF